MTTSSASSARNIALAASQFAVDFGRTIVAVPTTVSAVALESTPLNSMIDKHPRMKAGFDRAASFIDEYVIPDFDTQNPAQKWGQRAGVTTLAIGCIGAVFGGIGLGIDYLENAGRAPKDGDTVVNAAKCPNPPRLWKDEQGQVTLVIPKGCQLGQ